MEARFLIGHARGLLRQYGAAEGERSREDDGGADHGLRLSLTPLSSSTNLLNKKTVG
jgi:hypothetical protein